MFNLFSFLQNKNIMKNLFKIILGLFALAFAINTSFLTKSFAVSPIAYDLKVCMVVNYSGDVIQVGNSCEWGSKPQCIPNECAGIGGNTPIGLTP